MYEDAVLQEKEWAEFLFKDGSMIGLSVTTVDNYIEYIANKRLRMIGLKPIYDISSANNPGGRDTGSTQRGLQKILGDG